MKNISTVCLKNLMNVVDVQSNWQREISCKRGVGSGVGMRDASGLSWKNDSS